MGICAGGFYFRCVVGIYCLDFGLILVGFGGILVPIIPCEFWVMGYSFGYLDAFSESYML